MSQRYMSKIVYDAPAALRSRLQRNLPAAAAEWNKVAAEVLGVPGSAESPSRPGQAPRKRTGKLLRGTRAIPAASSLSIQIVTTEVGKYLDGGTRRMAARPFINLITRKAAAAMKAALHQR